MRFTARTTCVAATLMLLTAAAAQEGDKPQLLIHADTMKTQLPGFAIPKLPPGVKLPPEAEAAIAGLQKGQRSLRVELQKKGAPPASPSAELDIPGGLKLGPTLVLEVPPPGDAPDVGIPGSPANGPVDFTMMRYWGCGAEVRPGQPKTISLKDLTAGALANIPRGPMGRRPTFSGIAHPGYTDAYWPNSKGKGPQQVTLEAALPGNYDLRSNFVPGVKFEVPQNIDFLDPVSLTVPEGPNVLDKAIPISWEPVKRAQAYVAMATGVKGRNTMIMWTSAEREDGWEAAFNGAGDIKALVERGSLMPPTKTSCTIPTAIFKGCQGVSLQVIALGPSFVQAGSTPSVKLQTRSTGISMLGVPGRGGFGGGGFGGDQ